jgi:hypothetical protein
MSISIENLAISELLPQFAIRRIVVSENKATLSCALMRPREINYESWLGSSEFNSYIKYYFIATPNLSSGDIAKFYYPQDRVRYLNGALASLIPEDEGTHDPSFWELALGPTGLGRFRSRDDINLLSPFNLKGYTALTLEEILQGQYFAKDALTATETIEPTDPYLLDNPEGYNTSFQVSVELLNDPFESRNPTRADQLNIMAFAQLDTIKLKQDFGLEVLTGLSEIGSDLIYEKCLVRSRLGQQGNLHLVVPEERRIFFTADGSAYNGPAHYHGEQNPGPNGYVGWMSGPSTGDMTNRLLLEVRRVPNRKVISRLFVHRALNPAGFALTENTAYSGYIGTGEQEATDPGAVVFGDEIIRTLRSQMGQTLSLGDDQFSKYQDKLKELSTLALKRGQLNLALSNTTAEDLSWVSTTNGKPYHGSLFVVRLDDIISSNSRFGYLYSLHKSAEDETSSGILKSMLSMSLIRDFSIFRRRLTNLPVGNNSVSTAKHEIYDNNSAEEYIIQTISIFRNRRGANRSDGNVMLASRTNEKARIWERSVSTTEPHRVIILHDYDLFNNIHTGKYEYVIDITLEDGIQSFLAEKHTQFKRAIKSFSTYVKEASQPYQDYTQSGYYNGSQFAGGLADQLLRDKSGTTGNYNHSIGDFTAAFKERSDNLRERSDNVASLYTEIYYVLTGLEQFDSADIMELKNSLLAKNTTLESLEFFLDLCLKLESRFGSILNSAGTDIRDTLNLGSHRRNVSLGIRHPDKIINLRGSAKVLAKAVDKNSLFVSPDPIIRELARQNLDGDNRSRRRRRRTNSRTQNVEKSPPPSEVGAGAFFGLSQDDSKDKAIASISTKRPATFKVEMIADAKSAVTPEEVSKLNSRVKAAIEFSKAGPITQIGKQETIKDDMIMLDNVLEQYGGTKFEALLNKASFTSKSEVENKEVEKSRYTSKTFQESVFASVVAADKPEKFTKDIEEKYKDAFYKKKAVEELYDVVTDALSTQDMMSKAKAETSFKEKVLKSTSNKDKKAEKKEKFETAAKAVKENVFKAYMIDPDKGLVPATADNKIGVVIYKKAGATFDGAVVTDNVQILEEQVGEAQGPDTTSKGK